MDHTQTGDRRSCSLPFSREWDNLAAASARLLYLVATCWEAAAKSRMPFLLAKKSCGTSGITWVLDRQPGLGHSPSLAATQVAQ